MKRLAFIDVQNTTSTTQRMLHFVIDWQKLCGYLKNRWECERIFFYSGIELGDEKTATEFDMLSADFNCTIRAKTIMAFKNPDIAVPYKCAGCGEEGVKTVETGYRRKSNCDVELTVDAMENAGPDTEFLIFTADGDFTYLIEALIGKGVKVYIVLNARRYIDRAGITQSRFSTKLRELIARNSKAATMIDIARWKDIVKKDIPIGN